MRKFVVAFISVAALCVAGFSTLTAQTVNWNAAPLYGTATIVTGFTPDPYVHPTTVQAGGASQVCTSWNSATCDGGVQTIIDPTGGSCVGYINPGAPDVRVQYTAGTTYPIRFYAMPLDGSSDLTLLVNQPDTTWRCNDDHSGWNPLVHIDYPQSGQYDIWVGTYSAGAIVPATFYVTELTSVGP